LSITSDVPGVIVASPETRYKIGWAVSPVGISFGIIFT
jgi:hypothetical protein